ncbi:hypothetical protein MKW98_020475 [Papaver atlanticum]|uniref:RING-type domain-containing protein n=1 Tax=Papaver atlanticum TaxID=357466 RepID=A0AAD4RWP0_9MAGN|nr:hypothetical protein MKW98_020475 [Papaver atlanticum]
MHNAKFSILCSDQKVENSSLETQLLVEIQVLRSRQFWDRDAKTDDIVDVWQDDEPLLVKLFPISFRDLLSASDVFSQSSLVPLLSIIDDYCGNLVPTNFIPSDFIEDLEEAIFDISTYLAEDIEREKFDFVSIVIPIQVVRIVEVLHEESVDRRLDAEEEEQGEEEEDKVEGTEESSRDDYCDCDGCFERRHNLNMEFVSEMVSSNSVITHSSLFATNLKKFDGGNQGEERDLCAICLKEFEVGISNVFCLPCSHVLHTRCITRWFAQDINCPLCRALVQPQALAQLPL